MLVCNAPGISDSDVQILIRKNGAARAPERKFLFKAGPARTPTDHDASTCESQKTEILQ